MPFPYQDSEVLVSCAWLFENLERSGLRIIEVNIDPKTYWLGHVPGAIAWSWQTQLSDPLRRDILSKTQMEMLLSESGIEPDTTVILYGDKYNWFAAWAFWQLKIYGHRDVRLLNGGREKWLHEGHPISLDESTYASTVYFAQEADDSIRALLSEVKRSQENRTSFFIDVRLPEEFTGEVLAPPGSLELYQRGGHIPGAINIPWFATLRKDGTFKKRAELAGLFKKAGIDGSKNIITYSRIGERSSHTWFVLRYLLGHQDVKNYDGSWTEWGNLVGVPVERGLGKSRRLRLKAKRFMPDSIQRSDANDIEENAVLP